MHNDRAVGGQAPRTGTPGGEWPRERQEGGREQRCCRMCGLRAERGQELLSGPGNEGREHTHMQHTVLRHRQQTRAHLFTHAYWHTPSWHLDMRAVSDTAHHCLGSTGRWRPISTSTAGQLSVAGGLGSLPGPSQEPQQWESWKSCLCQGLPKCEVPG